MGLIPISHPTSEFDPTDRFVVLYDAWNRPTVVYEHTGSETNRARYEYDGLGRRIRRTVYDSGLPDHDVHSYYNENWQIVVDLEVTSGMGSGACYYFWHPQYIDALAMQWSSSRQFILQDANFNVTAVVDDDGDVLERYQYTPYGAATYLNPDFSVKSTQSSAIGNFHLYTGRELDWETGLQLNRHRYYASHLGRWLKRDPIGYEAGSFNLYAYAASRPLSRLDPYGMQNLTPGGEGSDGGNIYGRWSSGLYTYVLGGDASISEAGVRWVPIDSKTFSNCPSDPCDDCDPDTRVWLLQYQTFRRLTSSIDIRWSFDQDYWDLTTGGSRKLPSVRFYRSYRSWAETIIRRQIRLLR